jgi:hypothetical protein
MIAKGLTTLHVPRRRGDRPVCGEASVGDFSEITVSRDLQRGCYLNGNSTLGQTRVVSGWKCKHSNVDMGTDPSI